MAAELSPFFTKHAEHFGDKEAIKLIYSKICEAKEAIKKEPDNEKHYLKHLAEAHDMLEDFFECKGVDPAKILLQG